MKFCQKCGKQIDPYAQACPYCGHIQVQQQGYGYQQGYNQMPGGGVPAKGFAIASMVLGIVALCGAGWGGFVPAIVGVILGVMAKKQQDEAGAPSGMATAGVVMSVIALGLSVVCTISCIACSAFSAPFSYF